MAPECKEMFIPKETVRFTRRGFASYGNGVLSSPRPRVNLLAMEFARFR